MTEQQIRLAVIRSYYEVLVAEAQSQVAQEAVLTAQTEAERTRQMTETGLRVESDLLAAEVQLAQLEQQRIQTEGQVAVSRAALSVVLGLEVGAALRLEGELPESQFSLPEEAELLRLAFENRPDYAALREAASDAGRGVWGAKGQYLPQLDAFGSYGWSGEDPASGSSDYTLGAALTLHLFEPGRRARVEQARAQESLVQAEADALAQSIRLEVVRACRQFVSARSRLTVSARAVGQASEALRIVQDRYGEGLVTITEVLRAQTALLEARKNALQARFDHQVGYAMVLLASGRLTGIESFLEPTGGKQS